MHEKIINCQFGYQNGKNAVDCIFILHLIIAKVHSGALTHYLSHHSKLKSTVRS